MTYKKSKDSSSFPCKMVSLYVILTKIFPQTLDFDFN